MWAFFELFEWYHWVDFVVVLLLLLSFASLTFNELTLPPARRYKGGTFSYLLSHDIIPLIAMIGILVGCSLPLMQLLKVYLS